MAPAVKTAKAPTASEQYAAMVEKQFEDWLETSFSSQSLKGVQLYEHRVPSGMVFKVRDLSPEFLAQSGALPLGSLSDEVLKEEPTEALSEAEQEAKAVEQYLALSPVERLRRMQATARQVRFICVEPRIIVGGTMGHRNAISAAQLTMADFNSLAARSNPFGGAAAQGLKTFRKKRR